jgi:hypothetical protein
MVFAGSSILMLHHCTGVQITEQPEQLAGVYMTMVAAGLVQPTSTTTTNPQIIQQSIYFFWPLWPSNGNQR